MKIVYSIRIEEDVITQLQKIAKDENRTVANLIETAIKAYIKKSKNWDMKTTIEFYMKGEPKQYKTFDSLAEARAFMLALNSNPNCESYGIKK
jgi:predicted transcriptional regulator